MRPVGLIGSETLIPSNEAMRSSVPQISANARMIPGCLSVSEALSSVPREPRKASSRGHHRTARPTHVLIFHTNPS